MHVDPLVDAVVLQGTNHLQAGPIAHVSQPRIAMSAEVALQDAAVLCSIEERSPSLELAHAVGRFLGVQLGHAPVVDVLPAAHGVGEMDLPAVAFVDVGEGRRDAALGHHGVRLPEQRLADQPDGYLCGRSLDGRSQAGAPRADHENVVLVGLYLRAQRILQSLRTPIEQSRT